MDGQRKDNIDPGRLSQRNRPKQLQTYNVPTYDVEDPNGSNKGRDLRLANEPQIVSRRTERILQRIQRHRRAALC